MVARGGGDLRSAMPSDFSIRAAGPEDVPAVLPMVRAICDQHWALDPARYGYLPDVVERYAGWLPRQARDLRGVFLVAEAGTSAAAGGGTLVGFLIATIEQNIPIYTLTEFGYIHDVWVEPEFRGRGVARALTERAAARFAELGVRQVRLETAAGNDGARRLFAACGFRVDSVEMLRDLGPPARPAG